MDTMTFFAEQKVLEGDKITVPLKKGGEVTFMKERSGKVYIKIVVKENFYFDKTDILEIRSGSKSYYVKNVKQFKVDKTTGVFVFEIYTNYLNTLKELGITSIYFSKAETGFSRKDANEIKKAAFCISEIIGRK